MTLTPPKTMVGWATLIATLIVIAGAIVTGVTRYNQPRVELQLLFEKIDSVIEGQDDIRGDIKGLKGDVDSLKDDVEGLRGEVEDLKTKVSVMGTDIQWLKLPRHPIN